MNDGNEKFSDDMSKPSVTDEYRPKHPIEYIGYYGKLTLIAFWAFLKPFLLITIIGIVGLKGGEIINTTLKSWGWW